MELSFINIDLFALIDFKTSFVIWLFVMTNGHSGKIRASVCAIIPELPGRPLYMEGTGKKIDTMANLSIFSGNFYIM